ncbi:hypothetical protein ABT186_01930 [Streptomyces sp. NPDC001634]|uniref:hypothetical protein n=1 Tax=Streptomyces sp. NPDC001634 TaxID=3154390 RepID=UPI003321F774
MSDFQPGDKVTVTNPAQPTNHKVGDSGVVVDVGSVAGMKVIQIQNDRDGSLQAVYPQEIAKS